MIIFLCIFIYPMTRSKSRIFPSTQNVFLCPFPLNAHSHPHLREPLFFYQYILVFCVLGLHINGTIHMLLFYILLLSFNIIFWDSFILCVSVVSFPPCYLVLFCTNAPQLFLSIFLLLENVFTFWVLWIKLLWKTYLQDFCGYSVLYVLGN